LKNLDRTKLPEILQVMFAVVFTPNEGGKWGLPLILWSDVGWGKSSILKEFARLAWLNIYTLILGQMDQSDMKMDVPIEGQDYMKTVINGEMQKIMEDKNCIIGFDEYSLTDDRLQGLSMSLILERMLGPKALPSTAVPICLANPVGKGCGVNDTKRPQDDRLTHVDLDKWFPAEKRVAEWRDFQTKTVNKEAAMMQAFVSGEIEDISDYKEEPDAFDPHAERIRVAKAWAQEFRRADEVVGAFIVANPQLLHPKIEKSYRPKNIDEKAFPTSRSNSKAPRILAAARIHNLSERMKRCLLEGTMGTAWTSAYLIHERNYGLLPNTEDLLDGKETYKHDKSKPDILRQVLQSCTSVISATKDTNLQGSRITAMWTLMGDVYTEDNLCIDQLQPIGDVMRTNRWVKPEHRNVAGPVLEALRFLFCD
jgi:hypothetical protein